MTYVQFIGHRGYGPVSDADAAQYPENSIKAFRHALETGADGVELDVKKSKDDVPVVSHDKHLHHHVVVKQQPLVEGKGVGDFTFAELQQFDIGHGEHIPALDQVFELFMEFTDRRRILNLDVKDPEVVSSILTTVEKYNQQGFDHDIVVSSYNWDILREFRKRNNDIYLVPAIKTAILFGTENVSMPDYLPLTDVYQANFREPILDLHNEINCYAFDCTVTDFNPAMIAFALDYKVGLQFSTGNTRVGAKETNYELLHQLQESLDMGVPFVICKVDEPDQVKKTFLARHIK